MVLQCICLELISLAKKSKSNIVSLKWKSPNINLLSIELLYKCCINWTIVSTIELLNIKNKNLYSKFFCTIFCILGSFLLILVALLPQAPVYFWEWFVRVCLCARCDGVLFSSASGGTFCCETHFQWNGWHIANGTGVVMKSTTLRSCDQPMQVNMK